MKRKELKRKELMAALLASAAAEPPRVFDPDCMIRIPDCHSIIEVLRLIKHGGPEWASRYVSMWFDGASNGWVLVYPLQETSEPYFDFMYTGELAPQKVFAEVLAKYPQCRVMDWSVGRIACVIVEGGEVERLAEIIRAFTDAAWGEGVAVVEASYEEMGRA